MNLFTPSEAVANYAEAGRKKAEMPVLKTFILGIMAGVFIAFGCVATNTSAHSLTDVSTIRTISGLLFPGGITLVILMGAELFTGNCLLSISVLDRKITFLQMLRNWIPAYLGNFAGSVALALLCAGAGQMNYSGGGLAVYTMKLAIGKVSLPFFNAVALAFLCNILVCVAVLCSLSAKDVFGRIMGTFLPIAFFVICGFEHCVANMYYVPAGIFASHVPAYAAAAAEAGLDLTKLTWGNFFAANLLPVTAGNILGGVLVGAVMWYCHGTGKKQ